MTARTATGALPNLLIIGAQKCATTSLHAYLDLHPDVHMAAGKELDFFLPDRTWSRGVNWYAAQFRADAAVRGESSPNYTAWPLWEGVPERAFSVVPEARLIYLVRDPIARIESHYLQARATMGERRPIDEAAGALDDPRNTYLARSSYATQLERWQAHYAPERILVIGQEDLRDHRAETMQEVFTFLDLPSLGRHPALRAEHYRGEEKLELGPAGERLRSSLPGRARHVVPGPLRAPLTRRLRAVLSEPVEPQRLSPQLSAALRERLRPEAERLRTMTGRAFAGWSV